VLFKTNPDFGLLLGENVKQANWGIKTQRVSRKLEWELNKFFTDYFQRAKV
jgi:hypothetical protein